MVRPLLRKAICWNRARDVSKSWVVVSKMSAVGQKVTVVPVRVGRLCFSSGRDRDTELEVMGQRVAVAGTSTLRGEDNALTTEEPTPCRPPETL